MQSEPSLTIHRPGRQVELTAKEYAAVERVSVSTVWRWVAKGAVPVRRTPGGHLRIIQVATTRKY